MKKLKCTNCQNILPQSQFTELKGKIFCNQCLEEILKTDSSIKKDDIQPQIDPTICISCGKDNGDIPLETLLQQPICKECLTFFRNRPFPQWIKNAAWALAILIIFSIFHNFRFIHAYIDFKRGLNSLKNNQPVQATSFFANAAEKVPENKMLRETLAFYNGIQALQEDRNQEALSFLNSLSVTPNDTLINYLKSRAKIGIAFDEKNYDEFLRLSLKIKKVFPDQPFAQGCVISAYACKYAITGQEKYRNYALALLDTIRHISGEDSNFKFIENRMLHRLTTREIIDTKEFIERFPNGWQNEGETKK